MNIRLTMKSFLGGFLGAGITAFAFFAVSNALAAPTAEPPGGNPSYPLQAPTGNNGPQGQAGPNGPQGPQGTTNCTVCIRQCDNNGAGPCGSTCAAQNTGFQSFNVQGAIDSNDYLSVRLDC